jgi:hypothetical protein
MRKPAMSALWINTTNEQRSEGGFAGQKADMLPAQFSSREALRC